METNIRYLQDRDPLNKETIWENYFLGEDKTPKKGRPCFKNGFSPLSWINSLFPLFKSFKNYDPKTDIFPDLFTGITITILQIPQGMAYAQLSGVPAVYGLYASLFPVLVYAFMGTSRHLSMGTYAVTALMVGSIVARFATTDLHNEFHMLINPLDIVVMISFLSGVYQISLGALRLGCLSVFLGPPLVSSFTCASAFHVIASQLSIIFGIKLPSYNGPAPFFMTFVNLSKHIIDYNPLTLIVSGVSLFLLILFKMLIAPIAATKTKLPIPIELFLLVVGTLISKFYNLKKSYSLDCVGVIPTGIPGPSLPNVSLFSILAIPSIALTIVGVTSSLSMAKIFAKKNSYSIKANQELIALGAANLVGSVFACIPTTGSLSRSAVQDASGGKTQLVSLVSCVGVTIVLLYLAPGLYYLPKCILASIIIVSLKDFIWQVSEFPRLWNLCRIDATIWLITFLSVVCLNVDLGLIIGVCYSLLSLVYRNQRPSMLILGNLDSTNIYLPIDKYAKAKEVPGIRIIQFSGPIHFSNAEFFLTEVMHRISLEPSIDMTSPITERDETDGIEFCEDEEIEGASSTTYVNKLCPEEAVTASYRPITHIILECSGWSYVDTTGMQVLEQLAKDLYLNGVTIFLCRIHHNTFKRFKKEGMFNTIPLSCIFPSIHDAVISACINVVAIPTVEKAITDS